MRWLAAALVAIGLTACGEAAENSLPARVAQGCRSEAECQILHQQTAQRALDCRSGAASASGCATASADERAALGYLRAFREQRERYEQAQVQRAAAQQQQALDAERARRASEVASRDEAAWLALDVKGCAERGEPRSCEELRRFILDHPTSARLLEAAAALGAGRERMARLDAERAESARREADAAKSRAEQAEAAQREADEDERRSKARVTSSPSKRAQPAEPPAGRVCCCDGTISPTCTYVHRGCCSHHGGVCACE